ncbi:bifunctional folylpolyglutamate synthase/dihydrofolate synthase [Corallococcus sp. bb12-1]|uniref:bifunctional folylpolyglutamate synthase/dihydrofolate synthase n=1 Tax=Corallococcus sp. bb12-1 TaxID=2996784 RepID=UPI00226E87AB|nr:folylpolyglutamate synthase/dihydrofolate synthase family protein [Corallococcus sp. bb12-1]MCY1045496.1 bifunctional folylpolyglutamate synthase/dihydrofolate synthase [Corallococcus sp. bb12-1]
MDAPSTPEEALRFFQALNPSGIKLGLERVKDALAALDHPERDYPALHVAGTNGKGSTCAFVARALEAAGHRVGLYTSPHLVRVNERIRVAGEDIPDDVFGQRILEVLERYPSARTDPMTYFEFGTVVALWHFSRERVDVAVLETGLGGRLDATSAANPVVTCVTPVSFDHMEYLGHTLREIAGEKAGIFKPGVPVVLSRQDPEAMDALLRRAEQLGVPVQVEGRDFGLEVRDDGGLAYRGLVWSLGDLTLALRGPYQRQNAAVALACLEALHARGVAVTPEAARVGLATARWPGRLEEVTTHPSVVVDGAHNPAGVAVLLEALEALYAGRPLHLVFGVVADKDRGPMMRALFPLATSVHLTPLDTPRSLAPERYTDEARVLCSRVVAHASLEDALAGARVDADGSPEGWVLCTGSLFLVGAVKRLLA